MYLKETLMDNANPLGVSPSSPPDQFLGTDGRDRQSDTVAQTLRQVFITLRNYKVTRGDECDRVHEHYGHLPQTAVYSRLMDIRLVHHKKRSTSSDA